MRSQKIRRAVPVALLVMAAALGAAACGSGGSGDSGEEGEQGTIRFAFSPDPVWNWIEDQGILAEMEEESGSPSSGSSRRTSSRSSPAVTPTSSRRVATRHRCSSPRTACRP